MSRPIVAAVATTPESYREDVRRVLVLLQREHAGSVGAPPPVLQVGAAMGTALPGSATKSWQLAAVIEELSAGADSPPSVEVVVSRTEDPARTAEGLGWGPALQRREGGLHRAEPGDGDLVDPTIDLSRLTALWAERPRLNRSWAGRTAMLLPSLQWSRRWGIRGAVSLAVDHARAGRPSAGDEAEPQSVLELLRLYRAHHTQSIALLDATVSGSDDPAGLPRCPNLLLASRDLVALDAVGARVLGMTPRGLPWLRRLEEEGLGATDLGTIALRGGGLDNLDLRPHRTGVPPRPAHGGMWARWGEGLRRIYHGLVWKPWIGRPLLRLYASTPWGRLEADLRGGARPWA